MPTLFEIFGMRFFFYSNEHQPIHIHIENGDGRAKIEIETQTIIKNEGIKPKDIKKALKIIKTYKEEIITKWKQYYGED